MRLSALLASLTLIAMLFAGCSGDKGGDGDSTTSASGTRSTTGSGSSSSTRSSTGSSTSGGTGGTNGTNQPPTGSISAAVNGTNATFQLSGSDPDGDTLVWDLDFGDGVQANGTTLPTTINHTYASAGNFTANFTVTDGMDPATFSFNITTTAAAIGGGAHQAVDLSWRSGGGTITFPQEYANCADGNAVGITMDSFVLDQATVGRPFTITIASAAGASSISSWAIIFSEPDCSADLERFTATGAAPISGNVPAGAHDYMMVFSVGGANLTAHYETA